MKLGFTLLELLITILIAMILSIIAASQYQNATRRSQLILTYSTLREITQAEEMYYMIYGDYTNNISQLDMEFKNNDYFLFSCGEKKHCIARPMKFGFPQLEFYFQHKTQYLAEESIGKHYCNIATIPNGSWRNTAGKLCANYSGAKQLHWYLWEIP